MSHPAHIHPGPWVTEIEEAYPAEGLRAAAPQVIVTEETAPIIPSWPSAGGMLRGARRPEASRRDRLRAWAGAGIAAFIAGWFGVNALEWVAASFARSAVLGLVASAALAAGLAGAGVIIARELASLLRLKSVETLRLELADPSLTAAQSRAAIASALAVVPRDGEAAAAIAVFQRQLEPHHGTAQQLELLSRAVMKPLDRAAEAHVRTAVLRAFGITAVSPTALTDAAFFVACGLRMVRGVAAAYGHRPTAATTIHLLRRLLVEAGKLGALDIASSSLMQHLGGAVTERLATSAADALYASYRMARLGVMVMDLCRPVAFRAGEAPSIGSLVGNLITGPPRAQRSTGTDLT